jgi:hypothetical protein
MPACYSGPIPIDQDDRTVIWRWAKANGIDHGMSIDKVGDAINQHFFAGQAKPEWISDILSGRKTPFRELATDVWKKQYNRRQITLQAQDVARQHAMNPVAKRISQLWNIPRSAAVFGHGLVFPVTHGGDLALRPESWGVFMRGFLNTWTKAGSPAATERMLDGMKRQPLFDTALRAGLDVGERSDLNEAFVNKSTMGSRAWSALTVMRYELWDHEMQKYAKPNMTQEQVLDVGKNLAEWANHATGSAKGPLTKLGGNVLFGPKLVQSKLNRLFADPAKTINTFANWSKASAGEKAAAWTRLSGVTQYLGTGLGLLAVNQGVLQATNQKDKINFTDPFKSDFLAFKAGGMEWSFPGMHSEIRTLGKILFDAFKDSKEVSKETRGGTKFDLIKNELENYAIGKMNPAVGVGKELLSGQDFSGRPLPWTQVAKPKANKPPIGWPEYLLSHGPIPLTGPIRYAYDQLRAKGSSATDATSVIKALIIMGTDPKAITMGAVGATGVHIDAVKEPPIKTPQQLAKENAARNRAANLLLRRH